MQPRPLAEDEVPDQLRGAYNFHSQRVERAADNRGTPRMTIERTCPQCGTVVRIVVAFVRAGIRHGPLSGLCSPCASHLSHPQPEGPANPNWKGGRYVGKDGYVRIRHGPNTHVAEHRLVMEQKLGRPLVSGEVVHHKNRIRDDNRPENLELWMRGGHIGGGRYEDLDITQLEKLITQLQQVLRTKRQRKNL